MSAPMRLPNISRRSLIGRLVLVPAGLVLASISAPAAAATGNDIIEVDGWMLKRSDFR